jgi:hypothetical protein
MQQQDAQRAVNRKTELVVRAVASLVNALNDGEFADAELDAAEARVIGSALVEAEAALELVVDAVDEMAVTHLTVVRS